jgi:hypothetical protein
MRSAPSRDEDHCGDAQLSRGDGEIEYTAIARLDRTAQITGPRERFATRPKRAAVRQEANDGTAAVWELLRRQGE